MTIIKLDFLQTKEAILNWDANDEYRGIQMTGPVCLQIVLRGVNWLLSPIVTILFQISVQFQLEGYVLLRKYTHLPFHLFPLKMRKGHSEMYVYLKELTQTFIHTCLTYQSESASKRSSKLHCRALNILNRSLGKFSRRHIDIFVLALTFPADCLLRRHVAWYVKAYFLRIHISNCLRKILPIRVVVAPDSWILLKIFNMSLFYQKACGCRWSTEELHGGHICRTEITEAQSRSSKLLGHQVTRSAVTQGHLVSGYSISSGQLSIAALSCSIWGKRYFWA